MVEEYQIEKNDQKNQKLRVFSIFTAMFHTKSPV